LGVLNTSLDVQVPVSATNTNFTRGNKFFELSNHLGNVLATVSDKKIPVSSNNTSIDYYNADVVTATDYYPFGMQMPNRTFAQANSGYRYGFNGKENDNEVKGQGNEQDYGMRIYDPRLGRFLSVDPLASKYPDLTAYNFVGNSPILLVDKKGKEPDRNNAGTLEEATAQWTKLKHASAKDILEFIQDKDGLNKPIRYVYTKEKGWIDLQHYFGTLVYGKPIMDVLEPISGSKLAQKKLGPGANESYFSYEDLPSNKFASEADHTMNTEIRGIKILKSGTDLIETVKKHFQSAGRYCT
jgi:RHS repeat-associated protein